MDETASPSSDPAGANPPPADVASSPAAPSSIPPPLPPVAAATPSIAPSPIPPEPAPACFVFHGDAREYFRIWIVNAFLTVVTLGVFAAWAKVRKRRYLRGSTELLGHRFDYTANPWRLLIGNGIVVSLFLAYGLFGAVYPAIRIGAILIFLALLPWIAVRSLSFNAYHTVYRGLRFHFHPSLSAAVMLYLLKPLVILVTLGFYYPAWARHRQEFVIARHRIGTGYFRLSLRSGQFYLIYLVGGAIAFAGGLAGMMITGITVAVNRGHVPGLASLLPLLVLYGSAAYIARHYIFAETFKLVWNETRLDNRQFRSQLKTGEWVGLQCVNLLATIATCGLAYPWAVIRSSRVALSSLELRLAQPLETINAMGAALGSAIGDTAAEFAGLDFGL